jgi:hypothetical protein
MADWLPAVWRRVGFTSAPAFACATAPATRLVQRRRFPVPVHVSCITGAARHCSHSWGGETTLGTGGGGGWRCWSGGGGELHQLGPGLPDHRIPFAFVVTERLFGSVFVKRQIPHRSLIH